MASPDSPPPPAPANRYAEMTYRRAGNSGLRLPAISLGLWNNFGGDRPADLQRSIVRAAFDAGITHFDLANNYGPPPGAAETTFGRLLARDLSGHRDEIVITTKAGFPMWDGPYGDLGSRKHILASLDQSLTRLGTGYVDVIYHHRPDPNTPLEESMGALASAVNAGKAIYVGVSNYPPALAEQASEILASLGTPLVLHQPRYSMFDRGAEDGLIAASRVAGYGLVAFSPLAQGLLTSRYLDGKVPAGSRAATGRSLTADQIDPVYLERVRGLQSIAEARGQTLAQLALTWVLRHPELTSAIIGASSPEQLADSLKALEGTPLTTDELAAIDLLAIDGTGRNPGNQLRRSAE